MSVRVCTLVVLCWILAVGGLSAATVLDMTSYAGTTTIVSAMVTQTYYIYSEGNGDTKKGTGFGTTGSNSIAAATAASAAPSSVIIANSLEADKEDVSAAVLNLAIQTSFMLTSPPA
jgi:hypothetical protein